MLATPTAYPWTLSNTQKKRFSVRVGLCTPWACQSLLGWRHRTVHDSLDAAAVLLLELRAQQCSPVSAVPWLHTLAVLSTTQLGSAQLGAPCRCPQAHITAEDASAPFFRPSAQPCCERKTQTHAFAHLHHQSHTTHTFTPTISHNHNLPLASHPPHNAHLVTHLQVPGGFVGNTHREGCFVDFYACEGCHKLNLQVRSSRETR